MTKCPFFGLCGGCKYDFSNSDYQSCKKQDLPNDVVMSEPIWGHVGTRRRADFVAIQNHFGFYKKSSHDIIDIKNCPNVLPQMNAILPDLAALPWGGVVSVLVTCCDNGIVVNSHSNVLFFGPDFRDMVQKLPKQIIRFTWNGKTVRELAKPKISFDEHVVDLPDDAFLQPTVETEKILRDLVIKHSSGRVADLFCGLGNFTFVTGAIGFDISGVGIKRDLFKRPLGANQLNQYDTVIMDPPRAGANAQSTELAKSQVPKIIYISCNPNTWIHDKNILLTGGYKITDAVPLDQFIGSNHWELFSVFERK